ncbi:MAG: TetR/AcrR family transcriptional regulator [Thermodesulfobacteriota bacterium]
MTIYLSVDKLWGMEERFKSNEVVQEILDLAQNLLQERGYNSFSYRDLSKQVGIKTSSIHYYFPTKGDLAKALVIRYREHFKTAFSQIDTQSNDHKARLELYLKLFIDGFRSCRRVCLCSMLASDFVNLPEGVQQEVRGLFSDNEVWIAKVLEEGRDSGVFDFKGSPERMARMIFSALEGSTISARIFENEHRLSFTSDWIMRMLQPKS